MGGWFGKGARSYSCAVRCHRGEGRQTAEPDTPPFSRVLNGFPILGRVVSSHTPSSESWGGARTNRKVFFITPFPLLVVFGISSSPSLLPVVFLSSFQGHVVPLLFLGFGGYGKGGTLRLSYSAHNRREESCGAWGLIMVFMNGSALVCWFCFLFRVLDFCCKGTICYVMDGMKN
ncbi:hypothetical protein GGS26DRAFT_38231 [Hypomontagnella submonticulosa]|nr:hypothetical protein GGS26DRAFT_38231 [Hypomontagnella submonticulosa]